MYPLKNSKDMGMAVMTAPMARIGSEKFAGGEHGKDEILESLQSLDPKQV